MTFVFVVDKYFQSKIFILSMNWNHFRGYDDFIAEMRIIVTLFIEKLFSLGAEINGEEISDFRMFEVGLLVFLLPPVVAAVHIVF